MKPLDLEGVDTIAALLTGSSDGVVALVRISGPNAEGVRDRVFLRHHPGAWDAARLYLGTLREPDGSPGAEALCATFPVGRSYTGECCVEFHGYGGRINAQRLLHAVLAAGARQAEPGEFTLRAFLHGRMSLDQAEAVSALIGAQSEEAARQAELARRGALAQMLEPLREGMLALLAETEAYLDFPDEGLPEGRAEAQKLLALELVEHLRTIMKGHARSRRLLEGARVVLWGEPNAGKSTLLNALCGTDRSIVDDTPGTTRDVVETRVVWDGMPITLVDTAGIREGVGRVEQEGVRRSKREAEQADVVVHCVGTDSLGANLEAPPSRDRPLVVETKADLASVCGAAFALARRLGTEVLSVSAHTGEGLGTLKDRLIQRLTGGARQGVDGVVAATARQGTLIEHAIHALQSAIRFRDEGEPEEAVAEWLRRAARCVGEVSGRALPTEEVLGAIFQRFCIGK
ncbi:MAG: tRNA uridine-5-carboxymethylaminomethyl(34) synthesis GTPase MnmE [Myxococcota bacterium]